MDRWIDGYACMDMHATNEQMVCWMVVWLANYD